MIIDDDEEILKVTSELLYGDYEVSIAQNGNMGLKLLDRGVIPDIILLDINMPGMDGFETLKLIRQRDAARHIPVVFLTGLMSEEDELKGLSLGAVDYIRKPFNLDVLQTRLHIHMENGRRMRGDALLDDDKIRKAGAALSETEYKVASCLARGATNEEIAMELSYSEGYIKQVVSRILSKLCIDKRNEIKKFLK